MPIHAHSRPPGDRFSGTNPVQTTRPTLSSRLAAPVCAGQTHIPTYLDPPDIPSVLDRPPRDRFPGPFPPNPQIRTTFTDPAASHHVCVPAMHTPRPGSTRLTSLADPLPCPPTDSRGQFWHLRTFDIIWLSISLLSALLADRPRPLVCTTSPDVHPATQRLLSRASVLAQILGFRPPRPCGSA